MVLKLQSMCGFHCTNSWPNRRVVDTLLSDAGYTRRSSLLLKYNPSLSILCRPSRMGKSPATTWTSNFFHVSPNRNSITALPSDISYRMPNWQCFPVDLSIWVLFFVALQYYEYCDRPPAASTGTTSVHHYTIESSRVPRGRGFSGGSMDSCVIM